MSTTRRAALHLVLGLFAVACAIVAARAPEIVVAYHEWQMADAYRRAHADLVTHPGGLQSVDVDEDFERYEKHRKRLVELGALCQLDYTFRHVLAPTPDSRVVVQQLLAKQCPPSVDWEGAHPRDKASLRVTVWCRPVDLAAWQEFLGAQDQESLDGEE